MLKPDLARFLSENINLIENNDFDSLYNSLWAGIKPEDLTDVLLQSNIDFLSYMTKIPEACFWGVNIESIRIPGNIETIERKAFALCRVHKVYIEEGVKEISNHVFTLCHELSDMNIPKSITYIGFQPFSGSIELTKINFRGTKKEFDDIEKHDEWNTGSFIKKVVCTDGEIKY